eukprot:m.136162 g.136162  ORF g.136162 m.136162 type:complete len:123 (-) comp10472_c0_seq1:398-766(-)
MMDKNVGFEDSTEVSSPKMDRIAQTGRYDRKAMRARLAIEDWLEEQLIDIYESDDAWEMAEIDTEEIMEVEESKRLDTLRAKLKNAKNQDKVEEIATELLERLSSYAANYSIGGVKERKPIH